MLYRGKQVRRSFPSLLCLLLLATALVPALPGYVCLGMGGVHLREPCCPDDADHADSQDEETRIRAACCQAVSAPALSVGRLSPSGADAWLTVQAGMTATPVRLPQAPPWSGARLPLPRAGASPHSYPVTETIVLRI